MILYCRIRVNAYEIRNEYLGRIAEGLYLGPSRMDHSCRPNTTWYSEGPILVLKVIEDIASSADVRFFQSSRNSAKQIVM